MLAVIDGDALQLDPRRWLAAGLRRHSGILLFEESDQIAASKTAFAPVADAQAGELSGIRPAAQGDFADAQESSRLLDRDQILVARELYSRHRVSPVGDFTNLYLVDQF
jgi:hypothetical protein